MTEYAKVVTPKREILIPLSVVGFGESYENLFAGAVASGAEVWAAYEYNNFNNPFQQADREFLREKPFWTEIFRDIVIKRNRKKGEIGSGTPLTYIAKAQTESVEYIDVLAPEEGYWVSTADGIFVPGTIVPRETVPTKKEAMRRLEAAGMPGEQVSYFHRLKEYGTLPTFSRRSADYKKGFFQVSLNGDPSSTGHENVGARFCGGPIVMEVEF